MGKRGRLYSPEFKEEAIRLVQSCEENYPVAKIARDVQLRQLEATLYGSVDIIDRESEERVYKLCYYFFFSDFYRFSNTLDGAVVSTDKKAKFCLNPHAPRFEELKQSYICKVFGEAVCEPYAHEAAGHAYIAE